MSVESVRQLFLATDDAGAKIAMDKDSLIKATADVKTSFGSVSSATTGVKASMTFSFRSSQKRSIGEILAEIVSNLATAAGAAATARINAKLLKGGKLIATTNGAGFDANAAPNTETINRLRIDGIGERFEAGDRVDIELEVEVTVAGGANIEVEILHDPATGGDEAIIEILDVE